MKITRILYFLLLAAITGLILFSCGKSNTDPEPTKEEDKKEVDPEINEPFVTLNPKVDGRCAIAYVTYYGTAIPDPASMTHINYAFAQVNVKDNVYLGFSLQGSESRFRTIASLKNSYPELKICLSFTNSISGNNKGGFSQLSASEENRRLFAEDCLAFLRDNNIDGIDLDWEFPGLSWSDAVVDVEHDTDNYVLLVKQLRETLGSDYIISYAGYCTDKAAVSGGYRYVDIAGMDPYVDYVNIMAYDLDAAPHHHCALSDSRAYKDCYRSVQAYLNAGVSPAKLVLGIPFYGRISFSKSPTAISYKSILNLSRTEYRRNKWDDIASAPFVQKMDGTFYCGYDNPRSIAKKGDWVRAKGMYGIMYWEYDQDDSKGTLHRSVWNAVMQ